MADFGAKLRAYCQKKDLALEKVVRASLLDISTQVIQRTPVDKGRARGNWNAAINSVDASTNETTDKTGTNSIGRASSTVINAVGNVYTLTNSLPYARVLEYGEYGTGEGATTKTTRDGFSVQAPYGMVRRSISDFESALAKAISSNK